MRRVLLSLTGLLCLAVVAVSAQQGSGAAPGQILEGKRLFENETFGGNGRTCRTCHSKDTGTTSPADAQKRFAQNPNDPLFRHDGTDDGHGNGVSRMLADGTILVTITLHANVSLANSDARTVTLRRGILTTLNTPALDDVLMADGRQLTLESQAAGAIADHAQAAAPPFAALHNIAEFQKTNEFFTSPAVRRFALETGPAPDLPEGRTASEKRGRRFFENVPPDPSDGFKPGLCGHCHSGPMLNETNQFAKDFIGLDIPAGQRFISVGISEINAAGNTVHDFVFFKGTDHEVTIPSPDLGRALVTGVLDDPTLEHVNAFKILPLRGVKLTAPYFHDNSAKTLEDVAAHYAGFFAFVAGIILTPEDQQDIVAYLKLLK